MKRRIFLSLVLIALISAVIAMLVTGFFYFGEYEKRARFDLRQQLSAAAEGYRTGGESYIRSLRLDSRITLIEEDGDVIYDSRGSASEMNSHADRQEFIDAERSGSGTSERRSETMGLKTMYEAELLPDGRVLRMSVDIESLTYSFRTAVFFVILIFVPFCFILLLAAELITRRLAGPISRIDLDRPLDSNVYPELYPLLSKISGQNRKIELQLRELSTRQSVIRTVTSNMREGVIFTDPDQIILLSNGEARDFLQAIGEAPDAPRILDTMKGIGALSKDVRKGVTSRKLIFSGNLYYEVQGSAVYSGETEVGCCYTIRNVTTDVMQEQQRREFSANVSHELKTPLTSISGFAEIIKSGIAKPEDVPVFAGKIMADVKRLLGLIDDIIRLSHLESGGANEFRICDLGAMAEEVAAQYEFTAEQKNVTLSCDVGHVRIRAVMPFLRDIIANLIDNAIKYNRPEGKVTVSVTQSRSDARLTVKDTGIGIPADCRSRVFERFFRVDKNHSRKIGGTGLGLSIVKHAAEANGGVITLESELGKGTSITVTFPVCAEEKDASAPGPAAQAAPASAAGAKARGTPVPAPDPSAAAAGAA